MAEFIWPEPQPVFYRLYYNEDGSPKCYSMEDLPGKYVEVDRETYISHLWNVKIVHGVLQIIPPTITVNKLKPHSTQGVCCATQDICVIVEPTSEHIKWTLASNETN